MQLSRKQCSSNYLWLKALSVHKDFFPQFAFTDSSVIYNKDKLLGKKRSKETIQNIRPRGRVQLSGRVHA